MNHEIWWDGTSECLAYFTGEVPRVGEGIMIITGDIREPGLVVKGVRWRHLSHDGAMSAIVLVTRAP